MRWVYLVLLLVVVAIAVAFCIENQANTTVKIFRQSFSAPLSVFFVAVYLLGMWSGGTVVGFLKLAYRRATKHEPKPAS
jgi:uncharacterized integral membrane protein